MSTSSSASNLVPFIGHRDGAQPLAWRAGRLVSAAEFVADVHALATRLPARTHGVNLCRDRYCFAVALAAAMARGQISLLPASQAEESLRELQRAYRSAYLLVDDERPCEGESVRVHTGNGAAQDAPHTLAFSPELIAAIAFTSGSTGEPVPNPKTWGVLAMSGSIEAQRFALTQDRSSVIVGTVPPQHMYGLEATVIMPLCNGLVIHNERPFFPADVRAALASVDAERVLVSTPVHLRALLTSGIDLPPLRLVICATAPLSEQVARQFEDRFEVEVREVYGFTEAGMVATRRTVDGPRWRLLPGVKMRRTDDGVSFSGGHIPTEAASGDLIDQIDDQQFVLRGRGADLVNIAGKRTSIGYLDHQLCAIDGVSDGAFFLPESNCGDVTRLMAFAVAPGLRRGQLLEALSRRIDPVFLPRPLHIVEALPRTASGKLARSELIKLAQRCAAQDRAHRRASSDPVQVCASRGLTDAVVVERRIDPGHPALAGHFPGNPVVPDVVLLDEILDAVRDELGVAVEGGGVTIRAAKFLRPVRPGERLQIKLSRGEDAAVRFVCSVANETAVNGSLTLTPSSSR